MRAMGDLGVTACNLLTVVQREDYLWSRHHLWSRDAILREDCEQVWFSNKDENENDYHWSSFDQKL